MLFLAAVQRIIQMKAGNGYLSNFGTTPNSSFEDSRACQRSRAGLKIILFLARMTGTTCNRRHLPSNDVQLRLSFCSVGGGLAQNSRRPSAESAVSLRFTSSSEAHPSIFGKPIMMTSDVVRVLYLSYLTQSNAEIFSFCSGRICFV